MYVMDDGYQNALRTIASAYEAEAARFGGKTLSTVATIVVSSGSFFTRLNEGKPFLVHNLERLASWFRDPKNWPDQSIPCAAISALSSIGRPPSVTSMTDVCVRDQSKVECDSGPIPHRGDRA